MSGRWWESPLTSPRSAAVLCGALAVALHLNSLSNEFAYDDMHIIVENEAIQAPETLPGALAEPYWPSRYGRELGLWRPLTTAVYGLQWLAVDNNAVAFHTVNVLLHGMATGMVVVFLAALIPAAAAFFGGLLFAVHPVHVEAVSNVVGLAEILFTLFYLGACLFFLRSGERMGPGGIAVMCGLYALAFLTKEMAVTLPGVLFLLDGARKDVPARELGGYLKRRGPLYAALAVTAGLILYGRYLVLGSVAHPFAPLGADILEEIPRIWTVAAIWPHYVRLLFYPVDLAVDYSPAVLLVHYAWNPQNILGVLVALAFLALAWASWREGEPLSGDRNTVRVVGFAVLWFVITMSPVSNLLFLSGVLLAERTFYLPSVGFVAAAGWVFVQLVNRRTWAGWGATIVVVSLLGYRSWIRTPTWKDNLTIFDTLLDEHPESGRGQWVLGDTYFAKNRLSESLRAYRAAVGLVGTEYPLLAEIGGRLAGADFHDQAEVLLRFAWAQRPEFAQAPGLLAIVLQEQERWAEAEEAARGALQGEPDDPVMHHLLAWALTQQGRHREALAHRRQSIELGEEGRWEQWKWLHDTYLALGDTARAVAALDSAFLRVDSGDAFRQIDSLKVLLVPAQPPP